MSEPDHEHSILLTSLDLAAAERRLCAEALRVAPTLQDAAKLLGITRHALHRRIHKHGLVRGWSAPGD